MSSLLAGAMVALYPLAVYFGADRIGLETLAGLLAAGLLLRLLVMPIRPQLKLAGACLLALVGMLWAYQQDDRWLILHPVFLNVALMSLFGLSLLRGLPMIERIARWRGMPVGEHNIRYLRGLTCVWAVFFAVCSGISLATVWHGNRALWALWNGALVYVSIGALTIGELLYRRRFKARLKSEGRLPENE